MKRSAIASGRKRHQVARVGLERLEDRQLLSTFEVTSVDDSGPGTLRAAIEAANATPGLDQITFNIAGTGAHRIEPTTLLPLVTDPLEIDGFTQPGSRPNQSELAFDAVLGIEIAGPRLGVAGALLRLGPGSSGSTIRGLNLTDHISDGIQVFSEFNRIEGCRIWGNWIGIAFSDGRGNVVGGTDPAARNLISANRMHGITLQGHDGRVQGNLIGLDATGTQAAPNRMYGIEMVFGASGNLIGGSEPGARNVISGNGFNPDFPTGTNAGIEIDRAGIGNTVLGNYLGTDVTGTAPVGNNGPAIRARDTPDLTIGGPGSGEGNLISGQFDAISIASSDAFVIQGNRIGTDVTGTQILGAGGRIWVSSGSQGPNSGLIGGRPGAGNVIRTSRGPGILVLNDSQIGATIVVNIIANWIDTTGSTPVLIDSDVVATISPATPGDVQTWDGVPAPQTPLLSTAERVADGTAVSGTFVGIPGQTYTIDVYGVAFDSTESGLLGSIAVTPGDEGTANFSSVLPQTARPGTDAWAMATGFGGTSATSNSVDVVDRVAPEAPVILEAGRVSGGTQIRGTLAGVPGRTYSVAFYGMPVQSNSAAAASLLGTATVVPGSNGQSEFDLVIATPAQIGTALWAVATDPDGITSPPSRQVVVVNLVPPRVAGFRRLGIHAQPTRLAITFDADMDSSRASQTASYMLLAPGRDGKFGTADDRRLPIASAHYDTTSRVATVRSRLLLPLQRVFQLVIRSGALTDTAGIALDGNGNGQPGGAAILEFGGLRDQAASRPPKARPWGPASGA
jgi:hypothetical protein